jgi:hypothetical protein
MTTQWLVLIHHLPPKPDYLRVKVRRKLQRIGAVAVKNSVYVLPVLDETLEDFQWLRGEIIAEGGEAMILNGDFLEGVPDGALEQTGRDERDREYRELVDAAHGLTAPSDADLVRLRRQLAEIVRRDHFGAAGRDAAEFAVKALGQAEPRTDSSAATRPPQGSTWVTRSGIKVDRMASAWLVKRWIDRDATFRFVSGNQPVTESHEIRFDMFEGGFTHIGDRCTFEVLLNHFGLNDAALTAVAEVVHDIDCKDGKFGRPETEGVAALIDGIVETVADDASRLEAGAQLFERLHASFARKVA